MDRVCRVCMSGAGELIDIFIANAESPSLEEMINECVDVKINREDQYPKKMCEICIRDVHAAYRFKRNYQLTLEQLSKSNPLNISAENTLLEPIGTENIVVANANETITSAQDKRKKRVKKVIIKKQKLLRVQRMSTSDTKKRIRKKKLREPEYEQNLKTEQQENSEYPCKICGEVFALQVRLQMHMSSHDKQLLSTHLELQTSTPKTEHKCWRCQKCFSLKCNLNKHLFNQVCLKPPKAKSVHNLSTKNPIKLNENENIVD